METFEPCASYLTGKPVLVWRVGEWLENRCSRKVFHTVVPTLAFDFSLGGLALLPVVLSCLPLYALMRGTPRAEARDHRVGGGKEEGEHTSGSAPPAFVTGLLATLLAPAGRWRRSLKRRM